jgi:hypothetical protein
MPPLLVLEVPGRQGAWEARGLGGKGVRWCVDAVRRLVMPCCLLLAGCQTSLGLAVPAPTAPLDAMCAQAPDPAGASPRRLHRRSVPRWPSPERRAPGVVSGSASEAQVGQRPVEPLPPAAAWATQGGADGSRLRASIAFLAPDTVNVGLFYALNDCWTVGLVGQRLVQERTVDVEGQLIDLDNLDSFVPGFSITEETESITFGPFVRYRLAPERTHTPELSLCAYALEWGTLTSARTTYSLPSLIVRAEEDAASDGEDADVYRSVYLAASKQLALRHAPSFVCGMRAYGGAGYGVRTGQRYAVLETGGGDPRLRARRRELTRQGFVGWVGGEVRLPRAFALYGEVFTGDECAAGYGAGLRWTSPLGITFTLGFTNCLEAVPQRQLDLVYKPGGVGGQPSSVGGAGGGDGGSLGYPSSFEDEGRGRSRRTRR